MCGFDNNNNFAVFFAFFADLELNRLSSNARFLLHAEELDELTDELPHRDRTYKSLRKKRHFKEKNLIWQSGEQVKLREVNTTMRVSSAVAMGFPVMVAIEVDR